MNTEHDVPWDLPCTCVLLGISAQLRMARHTQDTKAQSARRNVLLFQVCAPKMQLSWLQYHLRWRLPNSDLGLGGAGQGEPGCLSNCHWHRCCCHRHQSRLFCQIVSSGDPPCTAVSQWEFLQQTQRFLKTNLTIYGCKESTYVRSELAVTAVVWSAACIWHAYEISPPPLQ